MLEDQTQRLRKNSYVKTKDQKVVTYANLRPYERKTPDVVFALSRKSYQDLIEYAEYSAPLPDITRIDSNTICSPPLPLPPRAEAIAVARPYIDLSYDSVDAVSAARRMGVSRVHSPVRQNTSARRDDARRPVANTAAAAVAAPTHARPEVSLEHMRYQLALEAINEYRRSQIRTAASSHTRSSIGTYTHSRIPAERRTLLPVHNQDSYGGYRHYNYGSTPRSVAAQGASPPEGEVRRGCLGATLRGCFSLLSRVPWGTIILFTFNLLIWIGIGYGSYRLLFWLVDECKSLWDTVSQQDLGNCTTSRSTRTIADLGWR